MTTTRMAWQIRTKMTRNRWRKRKTNMTKNTKKPQTKKKNENKWQTSTSKFQHTNAHVNTQTTSVNQIWRKNEISKKQTLTNNNRMNKSHANGSNTQKDTIKTRGHEQKIHHTTEHTWETHVDTSTRSTQILGKHNSTTWTQIPPNKWIKRARKRNWHNQHNLTTCTNNEGYDTCDALANLAPECFLQHEPIINKSTIETKTWWDAGFDFTENMKLRTVVMHWHHDKQHSVCMVYGGGVVGQSSLLVISCVEWCGVAWSPPSLDGAVFLLLLGWCCGSPFLSFRARLNYVTNFNLVKLNPITVKNVS